MHLRRLEIRDVRILHHVAVALSPDANLFVGPNGSGKTSLLEAVHLLGAGRSFRVRPIRDVIRWGEEALSVFGEAVAEDGAVDTLGVEKSARETRIRISGENVTAASRLARALPLVVMTPETQRLLSDGAELRRRLLDWALFHVEPSYLGCLQAYRRALRQRNAELRGQSVPAGLTPWNREVARSGERLHACREAFVAGVLGDVAEAVETLLGRRVEVEYLPGWEPGQALEEALAATARADLARGFTGLGPHRADLHFTMAGSPARYVLSRGESKLFVAAVMLGQLRYLARRCARRPVALVDDLASELDEESRGRLIQALRQSGVQIFATALAPGLVSSWAEGPAAVFHVERGSVAEMV